jgi:hypothetical protein
MPNWMKRQLFGTAMMYYNIPDGAMGGSGQEQPPQNKDGKDNTGDDSDAMLNTFWDDDVAENPNPQNPENKTTSLTNPEVPEQERIDTFYKGMNIQFDMDDRDMVEAAQSGDWTKFKETLNGTIKQAVLQTLGSANKLAEQHANKARDAAVNKANSNLNATQYNSFLADSMPELYGDKALQPFIASTFNQALVKSKGDKNKALDMTRSILGRLANKSAGTFTDVPNNSNRYRPNQRQQSREADTDFLELLGG